MPNSKLPPAAVALLQALQMHDRARLAAAFTENAVITSSGTEHAGRDVLDRIDEALPHGTTAHPIATVRRKSAIVVTVIVCAGGGEAQHARQCDWTISLRDGRISHLNITEGAMPDVPPAVGAYILATNTFDLERLIETFADDAIVNDQLHEYRGKAEISAWAAREIVGNRMTMHAVSARQHHSACAVTANVDGNFDKQGLPDPLALSFYFTVHDGRIVQLIILRNEPEV